MKKQFIKDLKAGDKVRSFFVAKHKQLEYFRDKSKGRFLTIVLADRSGHILARAWENAVALADMFEEEDLVAVVGRVEEYMGRPQVIIVKLRAARPEDKDAFYSEDDFVPQTDKDVDVLWASTAAAAEAMTNPYLKALAQTVMDSMGDGLRAAPASKAMHHSYRGGLLEHIVEMLTLSNCLFSLYPRLDHDLLSAGIILHDVGLVEGARYERDIDYSDAGRLVGHVVLGERIVAGYIAAIPDVPADLALCLTHMILSHHGEAERGAVREPQTLEAIALHLLNKLSAEVNHVQQVLDSQWDTSRPWTEFDRMRGRSYFRGSSHEPEPAPDGPTEATSPPGENAGEPAEDGALTIAERRATYSGKPATASPEKGSQA